MRATLLATTLALIVSPVFAQGSPSATSTQPPTEVGTTTMPPGQYYITEQTTHKSYSLVVSDKGNMILGAAPDGLQVTLPTSTAATTAPATTASAASQSPTTLESMLKKEATKGVEQGMSSLVKQGATKELGNLLK